MNARPTENEIVLFRYRNRLLAGVCVNISHTRARFAVSAKTSLNVPLENILQPTGRVGRDKSAGKAWFKRAERASAAMDLRELWELIVEEDEGWHLRELAELYCATRARARTNVGIFNRFGNKCLF